MVFVHYLSVSQVGSRRMSAEHSFYYNRAGCDRAMEVAARRAGELGLELHRPLPFAAGPASVFVGDRVAQAPPACDKPWKSCSLSCLPGPERHREMVFCCFGAFYRIAYAKDDLSEDSFLTKVWNHPAARYFRRTINGRGFNPVCAPAGPWIASIRPMRQVIENSTGRSMRPFFPATAPARQAKLNGACTWRRPAAPPFP